MFYYFLAFSATFVAALSLKAYRDFLLEKLSEWEPQIYGLILFYLILIFAFKLPDIVSFFETSRGFRTLVGLFSGFLGAYLFIFWQQMSLDKEADNDLKKRISQATTILPILLLFLFCYAIFAPRGEIDFRSIRSLRIANVEAEFAQARTELLFEIESEPQSFFVAWRTGLGEALHLARAEIFFLEAVGEAEKAETARLAYAFLVRALQPIAICAVQIDSLYGDQALLRGAFQAWGATLVRALKVAANSKPIKEILSDEIPSHIEQSRKRQIAALNYTSGTGKSFLGNTCLRHRDLDGNLPFEESYGDPHLGSFPFNEDELREIFRQNGDPHLGKSFTKDELRKLFRQYGDPHLGIESFNEDELREIFRQPMVAHATSLFFLWSGNPRAAQALLQWSMYNDNMNNDNIPGAVDYPGLTFSRGFTERWLNKTPTNVLVYLKYWNTAIASLEKRKNQILKIYKADLESKNYEVAVFNSVYSDEHELWSGAEMVLPNLPTGPNLCEDSQNDKQVNQNDKQVKRCKAILSYGLFTYLSTKTRNHLVFEAAREILANRELPQADDITNLASDHARHLEMIVQDDGLTKGNGATQQATRIAAATEDAQVAIAGGNIQETYALLTDTIALIELARAIRRNDEEAIERAISQLNRALAQLAALPEANTALRYTISLHRQRAREALLLVD